MSSVLYKKSGQDHSPRPLPLSPLPPTLTLMLPYDLAENKLEHLHPPLSNFDHPKSPFFSISGSDPVLKHQCDFLQRNILIQWFFFIPPILILVQAVV
ncbi:hypothetical protein VP01_7767g1 [Puccinia sorghi]|uniref:Uncharacterized protein n=1 Tax=Puccinia sorghi TaxID=27349 RepID=A0A0L6UBC6_9BASI|nr:hypothetical protein VP01_7767g1 [Puccinia sorghi]